MDVNDIKLLPHNQITYDKIQEAWKTSNKVAAIQATGTGKSYLILKCLYNEPDKNKLVLAPSNYILEQIQNEVDEELPNTILMTYADLAINTEDKIKNFKNIKLIVLDEFHRCGAEQWGNGVQKLLYNYPNAKILGTSATNIRFLDDNRDMAEELFNGNVVNNLSLTEAIVKKILPMPKYISALYTFNDEVENLKDRINNSKNSDEEKEELLKETDKMKNRLDKSKGIPQILKKYLNENSNYKFIVFCKNSQHLNEMKKTVVNWFKKAKIAKNIDIYTAYTNYNNTDKEVEEFKNNSKINTVKLLFSIDMFNEGIHIKDVSGVILLRATVSPIIYYQQIGRAIQVGKENNPLIFDFVNNFDNIGAKKFVNDLENYSKEQRENNNSDQIDDFEFMIFDEMQEVRILFEELEGKLINSWENMFNELKEFKKEFGNCNVPWHYKKNLKLSYWIDSQRQLYKKNNLSLDKIQKLEEICFEWDILSNNWNRKYKELIEYKGNFGDCNVPYKYKKNESLANWVVKQRENYKNGNLSLDKIEKLEHIDFEWERVKEWENMYEELIEYKKDNGNCNVPKSYKKINLGLVNWVRTQRYMYNKNLLSENKIKKLEQIGFSWQIVNSDIQNDLWNDKYEKLKQYKKENNNFNISIKDKNYYFLKNWISQQRQDYKKGILSENRIKKLEQIGFSWNVREEKWNKNYEILQDYYKQNGNINIPTKMKSLYYFIAKIKAEYKKGKLPKDKIEQLKKVNFQF